MNHTDAVGSLFLHSYTRISKIIHELKYELKSFHINLSSFLFPDKNSTVIQNLLNNLAFVSLLFSVRKPIRICSNTMAPLLFQRVFPLPNFLFNSVSGIIPPPLFRCFPYAFISAGKAENPAANAAGPESPTIWQPTLFIFVYTLFFGYLESITHAFSLLLP